MVCVFSAYGEVAAAPVRYFALAEIGRRTFSLCRRGPGPRTHWSGVRIMTLDHYRALVVVSSTRRREAPNRRPRGQPPRARAQIGVVAVVIGSGDRANRWCRERRSSRPRAVRSMCSRVGHTDQAGSTGILRSARLAHQPPPQLPMPSFARPRAENSATATKMERTWKPTTITAMRQPRLIQVEPSAGDSSTVAPVSSIEPV